MCKKMKSLIDSLGDECDILGTFQEEDVMELERRLGVKLPNSYCAFLKDYGCLAVAGLEFYGLVHGEPRTVPSVIFSTRRLRELASLPHHLVPVMCDDDCTFALDTSRFEGGECPVVEIWSGSDMSKEEAKQVATSFEDFFIDQVEAII